MKATWLEDRPREKDIYSGYRRRDIQRAFVCVRGGKLPNKAAIPKSAYSPPE